MKITLLITGVWWALGVGTRAEASSPAQRRWAIVVGHNEGKRSDVLLRYAERDAVRVATVFREIGGVHGADLMLLLAPSAAELRAAIAATQQEMEAAGVPSVLLFFFSGHADRDGINLGPSHLEWSELRHLLDHTGARVRVTLVDTCYAGHLVLPKGFIETPPISTGFPLSGAVTLVAADAAEVAQEIDELGGSFFAHYLIAGMRGAADADGDKRVSIAELNVYAARRTREATAQWAPAQQRPAYHFDLRGADEVVLTDLRHAESLLEVMPGLWGRLVITERDSTLILIDEPVGGKVTSYALPSGRYLVHLRQDDMVQVAELDLPWGGTYPLDVDDLTPTSYLAAALKGSRLEVRRHRVAASLMLESAVITGAGALPAGALTYGVRWRPLELDLSALVGALRFDARDAVVEMVITGLAVALVYEWPWKHLDLRVWATVAGQYWHQSVGGIEDRHAFVPGVGGGVGARLPVWGPVFAQAGIEALVRLVPVSVRQRDPHGSARGSVGMGVAF